MSEEQKTFTEIVTIASDDLADLQLMVCTTRGRDEGVTDHVTQLAMGAVDGLILILPDAAEIAQALDRRRVPYLLLDYDDAELAAVRRASATTGQDAVRLLLERIEANQS